VDLPALLKSHGYSVVACEERRDGTCVAQSDRFDLAIIDYYMPGMNGAIAVPCAARTPRHARPDALAILTGSYEDGLISDCLAAGATGCMFKNESNELFLARVHGMATLLNANCDSKPKGFVSNSILDSVGDGVFGSTVKVASPSSTPPRCACCIARTQRRWWA